MGESGVLQCKTPRSDLSLEVAILLRLLTSFGLGLKVYKICVIMHKFSNKIDPLRRELLKWKSTLCLTGFRCVADGRSKNEEWFIVLTRAPKNWPLKNNRGIFSRVLALHGCLFQVLSFTQFSTYTLTVLISALSSSTCCVLDFVMSAGLSFQLMS
jgi:hypothetical protein